MPDTIERVDPWTALGVKVNHEHTPEQALQAAGLAGWDVHTEPMYLADGTPVTGRYQHAVVRNDAKTDTGKSTLGQVGKTWAPMQNESMVQIMQAVTDISGATIDTLGSLDNGKRVFFSMKLPEQMQVGGVDPVDVYLAGFNSFDGQSRFQFMVTPVRLLCFNMQRAASRESLSRYQLRHTAKGVGVAVQEVREMLDLTWAHDAEFQAEADRLLDQAYTDQAFSRLTASLFPTTPGSTERQVETQKERRAQLSHLFRESPTAANIRGTRWAAYQAVTEWTDHTRQLRNMAGGALRERRAVLAVTAESEVNKIKDRAWELLTR